MENTDYTLLVVIMNTILHPLFAYLLHSRCSHIKMCCIECDRRVIDPSNPENDNEVI